MLLITHLLDSTSDHDHDHVRYAVYNLIWHCENTPPSAYSQLREEILNFPFDRPDSSFRTKRASSLLVCVPEFLSFIKAFVRPIFSWYNMTQCIEHVEQPIDDADEIYHKNLALVLDFFASKLHLYYSSSRLTLLLTLLSTKSQLWMPHIIPLPSRLKIIDEDALDLHAAGSGYAAELYWAIFDDFLHSNNPQALDQRRYAVAALACLKIIFGHSQPPFSRITWFSQHSRALRERMKNHSQRHHKALRVGNNWKRVAFYWHLRTRHRNQMPQKQSLSDRFLQFDLESVDQDFRSKHLAFLLPRSAYSHNILNFARYRVFRFGYLSRKHPTYLKRAIFALAKYIERITGEMAEVRTCESIWGRDRWFAAQ